MYLLDTNVISELCKVRSSRADDNVVRWVVAKEPQQLFLSAISVLEIDMGILSVERHDTKQANALRQWRDDYIFPSFEHRILDVTLAASVQVCISQISAPTEMRLLPLQHYTIT